MRIAHTMIRVTDLPRSVAFYTDCLGMTEFRRKDYPDGQFTLAFLGYGDEKTSAAIELTYNYNKDHYNMGNAFGHIALEVSDAYALCETVKAKGGEVVREAGPMKHGNTIIAFIKDPDGYLIELVQH